MGKCKCGCNKDIIEKPWHKYYRHDYLVGHRPSLKLRTVPCDFCGNTVKKRFSPSKEHLKHTFCSKKCAGLYKKEKNKRTCKHCGATFFKRGAKRKHPFCSTKCFYAHNVGRNHFNYKEKIDKTCPQCNRHFQQPPHKEDRVFCKNKCYFEFMMIEIDDKHKLNYKEKKWLIVRDSILIRDNHKCQLCGKKENLHVHHKTPFRLTKNNSEKNLITLCASCHIKEDMLFRNLSERKF